MARAIGLDIGARTIKVVELGGSAKAPRIQRLAIREIPPPTPIDELDPEENYDPDSRIVEIIEEVFKTLQLPKDDVCAAFDSGVTVFREITVPFFEDDQIRKIVKFEAENHLHSHSIDDVVVNWIKTGETRDGSRLTIFASPKVDLARRISILRRAGIEPASVDLDTTALYTTLEVTPLLEQNPDCIVIDVGAHTTSLILLVDGKPRVMRSFLLGSAALEAEITTELGVSSDEGRRRVLAGSAVGGDDLFVPAADLETSPEHEKSLTRLQTDVVRERKGAFVTKLHRESIRSLASVRTDNTPEKILLFGGGSLLPGVAEDLSERFGLPIEQVNLLDYVECKDPGADPEFAGAAVGSAVGCGLRMMGRTGLGIELLKDEFSPKNVFDVVKTALCVAVTLAFLALFALTLVERSRLNAEKTRYNNWAWVAKQMYLRVEPNYLNQVQDKDLDASGRKGEAMLIATRWLTNLPDDETQVTAIRNLLRSRHKFLQTKLGLARDIPKLPSALEVMVEVYKAFGSVPRSELGAWFQIEQMNITLRRLNLKIVMSDSAVTDKVERLLTASEYMKRRAKAESRFVEIGAEQRLRDGKVRVDFQIKFEDE